MWYSNCLTFTQCEAWKEMLTVETIAKIRRDYHVEKKGIKYLWWKRKICEGGFSAASRIGNEPRCFQVGRDTSSSTRFVRTRGMWGRWRMLWQESGCRDGRWNRLTCSWVLPPLRGSGTCWNWCRKPSINRLTMRFMVSSYIKFAFVVQVLYNQ